MENKENPTKGDDYLFFLERKKIEQKEKKKISLYLHVKFNHSRSNRTLSQCQFQVMDAAG